MNRRKDQLAKQAKTLDVSIVETMRFGRKGLDQAYHSSFGGKRYGNH